MNWTVLAQISQAVVWGLFIASLVTLAICIRAKFQHKW